MTEVAAQREPDEGIDQEDEGEQDTVQDSSVYSNRKDAPGDRVENEPRDAEVEEQVDKAKPCSRTTREGRGRERAKAEHAPLNRAQALARYRHWKASLLHARDLKRTPKA